MATGDVVALIGTCLIEDNRAKHMDACTLAHANPHTSKHIVVRLLYCVKPPKKYGKQAHTKRERERESVKVRVKETEAWERGSNEMIEM